MSNEPVRRLAAIMFTDIVGYTALMGSDETRAFKMLSENREIHKSLIQKYGGVWLKEMGDGILCSFPNSSDAVRCAGEIQHYTKKKKIPLRIGIHEGEVVFHNDDVLGDGVNVASRLEQFAKDGEIIVSESIYKDIKNKTDIKSEYIGEQLLKNVRETVRIYIAQYHPHDQEDLPPKPVNKRLTRNISLHQKQIPYYLTGAFLVVLILVIVMFNLRDRSIPITDRSIIVLPFKNDSPDQENEYFCNGMMEEILTHLQKIEDLRVKSRTSSELYRYRNYDVTEIARDMNVAYVLEGSVRKVEDNLRITTQLIDATTGNHLWAETYDGKYTVQVFEFQSKTASSIASSLEAVITPEEEKRIDRKPTTNIIAYDLKIKGFEYVREWSYSRDTSKLKLARIMADEALEIDPEFIDAIDLKALTSMYLGDYDSALFYYNKIILLDPGHHSGYTGKGHLYMRYLNNPDSAFKYLVKGISLAPNNPWVNLALAQNYSNNKNEVLRALPFFDRAYALDGETSPEISLQITIAMANIGDYATGLKFIKKSMNIRMECIMVNYYNYLLLCNGNFNTSYHFLDSISNTNKCLKICNKQRYLVSILQNNIEQAQKYFQEVPGDLINPIFLNDLTNACFFKRTGNMDQADRILENVINENLTHLKKSLNRSDLSLAYWLLCGAFSMLNDKENALHYLVKLEESGFFAGWQDFIMIFPAFENLWEDPQFNLIMDRVRDKKTRIRDQVNEMRRTGEISI